MRHVGIDKSVTGDDYEISLWQDGECMHRFYAFNVGNYAVTIQAWLDGESFNG